jgi:Predicted permease
LVVAVAVPTFTNELQSLIQRLPGAWQSIRGQIADFAERYPALQNALPQADQIATTVGNQAGTMANVLLRSTLGVVGGVFVFVFSLLVLIFVFGEPKAARHRLSCTNPRPPSRESPGALLFE